MKEYCGLVGIYGHPEAARLAYLGLYALQHRGQESAGIISWDGHEVRAERGMGLVAEVFTEGQLDRLAGDVALGHVRYSTAGDSSLNEAQPLVVRYSGGFMAVGHNGNIVNALEIRAHLVEEGSIFQSTSDSEVIVHLIARSRQKSFADRIVDALSKIRGAYSLLFLKDDELIAIRDPYGFRPLVLGKLADSSWVIVSETCALDLIEARLVRELDPGEMLIINRQGIVSHKPFASQPQRFCVFEYIYFARPDSVLGGRSVHAIRKELGRQLARETKVEADLVIAVPDSGTSAALGFAEESGIAYDLGLIRNRYVGRTFIEPRQSIRHFGVKVKLNAVKDVLCGKRVIIIDDSLVRATTSRKIVKMIRAAGATQVHLRIASPPMRYPCYYGIDTPTRRELIASTHSVEEICRYITSDSLAYLSIAGMKKAIDPAADPKEEENICLACFTGDYPISFPGEEIMQSARYRE
ncbi:MAG: amidophosphoribosyltransferase [bacterium]|nr:amidophosphoribosyltransferase [bacterium]